MNIPHSKPTVGKEEASGLQKVLTSGRLTTGEEVTYFEQEMASYLGLTGGVATSSGTAALHLSLLALGVKEADEVIIPSFTCNALLNAVHYCRATPIVVDIDEGTMNISFSATHKALSKNTAAIIVPHMFGHPVENMSDFLALGPPVIEDCAQSLGATSHGTMTGTSGAITMFSFYATKVITTGHGGMVVSRNEDLLDHVRDLREYDKKTEYRTRYNYCMTDLQGKMGRIQLEKLPTFLTARMKRAQWYTKHLSGLEGVVLPTQKGIYYRYVVKITKGKLQEALEHLHQNGIEAQRPVFSPLHRYLGLNGFDNTEKVFSEALSLPLYPRLKTEEVAYTARFLNRALQVING
jgi:dTDP-4-amino-4,6-dideoxygalactose transaminase